MSATNVDNSLTSTPNPSQTPSAMASTSSASTSSASSSSASTSSAPSSVSTVTGPYWKYLVEPRDLTHGEYEYHLPVQTSLGLTKPKEPSKPGKSQDKKKYEEDKKQYKKDMKKYEDDKKKYEEDMDKLDVLTTALIRTSGGLVKVDSVIEITELLFDTWCLNYKDRLRRFIPDDVYHQCIDIRFDNGSIFLLVKNTPKFITTNTHLQTRVDSCNLTINYYEGVVNLLSQPITPPVQQSLQPSYKYGDVFTYSETKNIEFKCFTTTSVSGLMEKLTGGRNHGLLFGFGNTCGGGYAMVGIYEDTNTGTTLVYGQPLLQHELPLLETAISDFLTLDSTGSSRIWGTEGYKPQKGTDWDIHFVPVTNGPVPCHPKCKSCGHATRYLVIIHIYQFDGGVFEKTPESYQFNDDGDILQTSFSTWKRKHQMSTASTTSPAGSQTTQSTSPVQLYLKQHNQQPAQLDLKQHNQQPVQLDLKQHNQQPAQLDLRQHNQRPVQLDLKQHNQQPVQLDLKQHNQ